MGVNTVVKECAGAMCLFSARECAWNRPQGLIGL